MLCVGCGSGPNLPLTVPPPAPPSLGHHDITLKDLPPPDTGSQVSNGSRMVPKPEGARLVLPPGFEISIFAQGDLSSPRWMVEAPNGDVFVAESNIGRITVLRDHNKDGAADEGFTFATGLQLPFGMAFWKDYFYVAKTDAVSRFKYQPGDTQIRYPGEKVLDLPGKGYNQHWTRNILFSPDGNKLFTTVGSETNVSVEPDPMRAAITVSNPDGTDKKIYAGGLRNPVGLAFQPGSNTLWTAVNERDLLGDDLVPDYVTSVKENGFYGWPYSYIGQHVDPRRAGERPDLVSQAIVPDVLIQAHSAALGLVFYTGQMFPKEYQGNAFVALHGSWNRAKRTGYKVICIPFKDGRPTGGYDDFVVGWQLGENKHEVWGRPVGLLQLRDGSLLIADDGANKIFRVTYRKAGN
ncbi:MAG: sorbosone dehydrogenase family protein [Blastocatellia bacterium]|nr:sorbosone dehydrogenase family protein [Blastocatellia bacterium]